MVCAPQSKALPALYSPKPWGHREWVYSSASLKTLSLAVASKEEKSAFYYCLILVSLVCKFSVVSLNWTIRSLWIDLLLWKTELEASLKSGSLGNSQPPQLTPGKMDSIRFPYQRQTRSLPCPKAHYGGSAQAHPCRHTEVHVLSPQTQRIQWKSYHTEQGQYKIFDLVTSTAWWVIHLFMSTGDKPTGYSLGFKLWRRDHMGDIWLNWLQPQLQGKLWWKPLNVPLYPLFWTPNWLPWSHVLPNVILCVAHTFKRKTISTAHNCKTEGMHIKPGFLHTIEKALAIIAPYSLLATIGWALTDDFFMWGTCLLLSLNPHCPLLYFICSLYLVSFPVWPL